MPLHHPGLSWAWIIVLGLPLAACAATEMPGGDEPSGGTSGSGGGGVAGTSTAGKSSTTGGTSSGGTTGGTAGGTAGTATGGKGGGSTGGAGTTGGATTGGSSPGGAGSGGSGVSGEAGASSGAFGGGGRGGVGGSGGGGKGSGGTVATGGTATGGSSTAGSSNGGSGGLSPRMGCGATPLESGRASINVGGTMREYILKVPDDYDANTPYKLIFGWHWRGGVANDVATGSIIGGPYYGLESRAAGTAIFVAPEGIDMGWANTGGRDMAFLRAMLDLFNSTLCIDPDRIFSTGFSYGGMMSDAIGCEMADVFRAIAPNSGALYSGCTQANDHPIAVLLMHGNNDTVVPLADGQAALDVFLERDACGTATTPVDPSPCVSYSGCTEGYPVVYCEFSGGHMPWGPAPDTVWDFFNQF